ncbi:hypothetical protein [Streptomyces cavernicola]|uniref:Uncharacterized protein n=1 Tax=Streptomyces cavernicola TaxID=3043613 RepID=A0ABT6SKX6_9ACTN|nr:hypothetical protein [Streptomyces sp. B-S-A6]MDI3407906.1 hypothetical protein [Streptomyces sp. B-S-A6]
MARATSAHRKAARPSRRLPRPSTCWRDGQLMGAVLLFVFWFSLITFVFAVVSQNS